MVRHKKANDPIYNVDYALNDDRRINTSSIGYELIITKSDKNDKG